MVVLFFSAFPVAVSADSLPPVGVPAPGLPAGRVPAPTVSVSTPAAVQQVANKVPPVTSGAPALLPSNQLPVPAAVSQAENAAQPGLAAAAAVQSRWGTPAHFAEPQAAAPAAQAAADPPPAGAAGVDAAWSPRAQTAASPAPPVCPALALNPQPGCPQIPAEVQQALGETGWPVLSLVVGLALVLLSFFIRSWPGVRGRRVRKTPVDYKRLSRTRALSGTRFRREIAP